MDDTGDDPETPSEEDTRPPPGLVAVGGTLDPDFLIQAYRAGMFPWSSDPVITWWSPRAPQGGSKRVGDVTWEM